jgi:hypothetical protein
MTDDFATIYMELLDEGTPAWRPVQAVHVAGDFYRVVSENLHPGDERWRFPSGSVVRCEERFLSRGSSLVAVALAE